MNCQAVQNQILMLPDPRELPPALREHVLACAECQAWSRHAARLETILERLPAPPAPEQKKELLLGDLLQVEPIIRTRPTPATRPTFGPKFGLIAVQFLRRNATYIGGLAAAILIVIGIYALWPRTGPTPELVAKPEKHPFLEKVVAQNVSLAHAKTPAERLQVLNNVADTISANTRDVARIAPTAKLNEMAGLYDKTVKQGVVAQAKKLPADMDAAEKTKLLDACAAKLNADAAAAETLSREVPPDAQRALMQMATTAREGEKALRDAVARGVPVPAVPPATPTVASSSLNAEDKIRLLEENGTLIVSLVEAGIAMASEDTDVKRVTKCREVSLALANAIHPAASNENAERVAELTSLFHKFVRDGFSPMLEDAKRDVDPKSPAGEELQALQGNAANDLAKLKIGIGNNEKMRENQRVQEVVKQLDELKL